MRADFRRRGVEGKNLAIHARFAYAASNELSVLRAKVEYDYSFMGIGWQKRKPPRAVARQR
jgi:hypothetical protein